VAPAEAVPGTTSTAGAHLVLEFSDTGIGIAPEVLPRIFEAFEQGQTAAWKRASAGLGLGLAISRSIVEAHGGRLQAASAGRSQGARFTIALAASPAPGRDGRGQVSDPDQAAENVRHLRILLVEDDKTTLQVLERLLRRLGHTVLTAGSIAEALEVAGSEEFDLMLSDLGLPDGNGLDLMRQLQARRAVKGVALTGYGMDEDIRRSHEAGFVAHLTKPIDIQKLKATLQQMTAEQTA